MRALKRLMVLISVSALALCGCSDTYQGTAPEMKPIEVETDGNSPESLTAAGQFVMRVGHVQTKASPRHRSLLKFKEEVEDKTNGKIKVEIYPNGMLGGETEMTDMVENGELEAVRGGDLEYVPKSTMLGLPMIADNIEEARKLCSSDLVKDMLVTAESDHNMKVLAIGDYSGFMQFTNNVRKIRTPEDMRGLKMRTALEVTDLSMEAFGAYTETIPFTGLYDALADGKVDGQENPLAVIDSNRLYEVQKYVTIIDYMFLPELMYVNLDWWNELDAGHQEILESAARSMMEENSRITDSENEQYIEHLRDNGCEVTILTSAERDAFRPLAKQVWRRYVDIGRISGDELDEMLAVIGKKTGF